MFNNVDIGFDYSRTQCEDFRIVNRRWIHPGVERHFESPTCPLDMTPVEHAWGKLDDELTKGLQLLHM